MYYSAKRQAFLVDQGYAFKVISHLNGLESLPGLAYSTPAERRELLQDVMLQNEEKWGVEEIKEDLFSVRSNQPKGKPGPGAKKGAKRTAGLLSDLSGGQDMVIICYATLSAGIHTLTLVRPMSNTTKAGTRSSRAKVIPCSRRSNARGKGVKLRDWSR